MMHMHATFTRRSAYCSICGNDLEIGTKIIVIPRYVKDGDHKKRTSLVLCVKCAEDIVKSLESLLW